MVAEGVLKDKLQLLGLLLVCQVGPLGEPLVLGLVRVVRDGGGVLGGGVEPVAVAPAGGGLVEAQRLEIGTAQARGVKPRGGLGPGWLGELVEDVPDVGIVLDQVSLVGDEDDQRLVQDR